MRVRALAMAALYAALSAPALAAQTTDGYSVPEFLGTTFFNEVEVSPGGRWVAFITSRDDFDTDRTDLAVWVVDGKWVGKTRPAPVRLTTGRGSYSRLRWSSDDRILAVHSASGSGGPAILTFDSQAGWRAATLPSPTGAPIVPFDWAPDGRSVAFVSAAPIDSAVAARMRPPYGEARAFVRTPPRTFRLYRSDLTAGALAAPRLVATLPKAVRDLAYSPDGKRLALLAGDMFVMPAGGGAPPAPVLARSPWQFADGDLRWTSRAIVLRGYGALVNGSYVRTQRKLYAVNPENGTSWLAGAVFPGEWLDYAPLNDGSLFALGIHGTGSELQRIDAGSGKTRSLTQRAAAVGPFSASAGGDVAAFVVTDSSHFPELFVAPGIDHLDRVEAVTAFNRELGRQPRPSVETIRWPNGEGDTIEGLLYWPPGKRHASGLPTVIALHGGPQQGVSMALAASSAPFANYPALLASRGYLVLYPVFRGSTGYGDRFTDAFVGARCTRPAADILTGVDYLVKQGWADSTRLGIGGTSFGGTTTSCIIGRTRRFRAAFVSEGSFDGISANLARPPAYSSGTIGAGDASDRPAPWTNFDQFWKESGISTAGAIRTPTLIVHGGKDPVVSFTQSEELAAALDLVGTPYELLRFPSEGHMFSRPGNKRAKVEAEIAWLDHWMLGTPLPE